MLFEPGAFDDVGKSGDVLAVGGGGFSNVLGSVRRESLVLEAGKDEFRIGLTKRATDTARRIVEESRVTDFYARPVLDNDLSEFVDVDRVRTFKRAHVRAILVKPTPNSKGHTPAIIEGAEETRRRIWL